MDAGKKPLPRKLIITYKELPGHPQFIALLDHWNVKPEISDDLFTFKAPENARLIDMKEILSSRQSVELSGEVDDSGKTD